MKYIFAKTEFTLKLWEKQRHTSKELVLQIWGWYLKKKLAFAKILFEHSIRFHYEIQLPFISNVLILDWEQ